MARENSKPEDEQQDEDLDSSSDDSLANANGAPESHVMPRDSHEPDEPHDDEPASEGRIVPAGTGDRPSSPIVVLDRRFRGLNKLVGLIAGLVAIAVAISGLTLHYVDMRTDVDTNERAIEESRSDINELEGDLENNTREFEGRLTDIATKINSADSFASGLSSRVGVQETSHREFKAETDRDLEKLEAGIGAEVSAETAARQRDISDLDRRLDDAAQRIVKVEESKVSFREMSGLSERVTSLEAGNTQLASFLSQVAQGDDQAPGQQAAAVIAELRSELTALREESELIQRELRAAQTQADSAIGSLAEIAVVPTGGVIAYYGNLDQISLLDGWELCDGGLVSTPGAVLTGRKPDLGYRFVMGITNEESVVDPAITGGVNETPEIALGRTGAHQLTIAQMPRHSHSGRTGSAGEFDPNPGGRLVISDGNATASGMDGTRGEINLRWDKTQRIRTIPDHVHSIPSEGGNQAHSHSLPPIPSQENRPAYVGMYYIIRVK